MTKEYVAYIDEAGDEGFGKLRDPENSGQSRWLLLGAAIFSAENDRKAPGWRNEIMQLFPKKKSRDLHFRFLNHDQRVVACDVLGQKPIGACVIASNKETLLDSPKKEVFKQKGYLYNYLVRFLLERVTDAVALKGKQSGESVNLKVVFSRRGGTDYKSMHEYLCLMRDRKEVQAPVRSVNWDVLDLDNIRVENHSVRAGLQIADVITSATYNALDPNQFGYIEPRYAMLLKQRYIKDKRRILNCGITLVPRLESCILSQQHHEFLEEIEQKK